MIINSVRCACAALLACSVVVERAAAEDVATLSDLVVINRVEESLRDVPASVSLISRPDIVADGAINLAELLKTVPGVDLQGGAYPGDVTKPILRGHGPGLQSKRVLVLVDGRRVAEPFQSAVEFALFASDNIERVEVLRGPASALFGSDAMAGVINIITRRGGETPVTELRAGYGSYDLQQYRVAHGGQQGDLDYFLTGSYQDTDGHTDNPNGSDRDWRAKNVTGNFGWALGEDGELRFLTGYYEANGTDADSERSIEKDYQHVVYTRSLDDSRGADLLVRAYRNGDDQVYDWVFPGLGRFDMETTGAEIQQSLLLADEHRLTGGIDIRREDVDIMNVTGPIDEDDTVYGFYIQDDVHVSDAVTLRLGVRNDHDDDYGDEISPRVAALWRHSENGEVYASFNLAHRAPALSDRFFVGEFDGRMFVGNPDLDPETMKAYEIGTRQRCEDGGEAQVAVYYNDLEDSFEFAMDPDGVFRNRNVAESRIYGVEASVVTPICDGVTGFVTYNYADGEYEKFPTDPSVEGNQLQYLAKHTATAGLQLQCEHGQHGISVRYADERFADDRNTQATKLDDYVVVDLQSRIPVSDNVTITLNVDNVFDENYEEFFGIQQAGTTVLGGVEVTL